MKLPPPRTLVAAVAFTGYFAVAFAVRDLYPFSTFAMYAGAPPSRAPSRVIARDAAGGVHEVDELVAWRCDGEAPPDRTSCLDEGSYATTTYLDRAASDWIAAHPGSGGAPVDVVRRIYRLADGGGPPIARDCVLRRCRAELR